MRVQQQSFYADLFTKKAGPGRDLVVVEPPVVISPEAAPVVSEAKVEAAQV